MGTVSMEASIILACLVKHATTGVEMQFST